MSSCSVYKQCRSHRYVMDIVLDESQGKGQADVFHCPLSVSFPLGTEPHSYTDVENNFPSSKKFLYKNCWLWKQWDCVFWKGVFKSTFSVQYCVHFVCICVCGKHTLHVCSPNTHVCVRVWMYVFGCVCVCVCLYVYMRGYPHLCFPMCVLTTLRLSFPRVSVEWRCVGFPLLTS